MELCPYHLALRALLFASYLTALPSQEEPSPSVHPFSGTVSRFGMASLKIPFQIGISRAKSQSVTSLKIKLRLMIVHICAL